MQEWYHPECVPSSSNLCLSSIYVVCSNETGYSGFTDSCLTSRTLVSAEKQSSCPNKTELFCLSLCRYLSCRRKCLIDSIHIFCCSMQWLYLVVDVFLCNKELHFGSEYVFWSFLLHVWRDWGGGLEAMWENTRRKGNFFIDFTQMLDITTFVFCIFRIHFGTLQEKKYKAIKHRYLIFVYADCVRSDIKFCCSLHINDVPVSLLLSLCCCYTDTHKGKQLIIMDPQMWAINYNMHTPRWPNPGIGFTEK